jgi:hypothetical protein
MSALAVRALVERPVNGIALVVCGAAACCAATGCAGASSHRFVRSDEGFQPAPRAAPPTLLADQREVDAAPPFKFVGVIELEGNANETVDAFLARLSDTGARLGCEYVVQRDLFGLGQQVALRQPPKTKFGPDWLPMRLWAPNEQAKWQFFCGVGRVSPTEAWESRDLATATAARMRTAELGEGCQPYTPTGSHIRINRVCAEASPARP